VGASGYAKDVLVSTDWVADHLGDAGVAIAEVDENTDLYDEGHIPYTAKERDESIRAYRDYVHGSISAAGKTLVDVRSPQEYSGELLAPPGYESEGAQRGGHIPSAQ
jgi:3-mercaptopyruvate sulfurtransferase SseA